MMMSMYGTRDAASNWERDWQEHVRNWGFQLGLSSKNLFHRADITFIVIELCQRMSSPTQQSLAKLKRLVRYLTCERQWRSIIRMLEIGRRGDNIHRLGLGWLQGDSKVVERRRDNAWLSCFESNTRKQKIIAMSSAEAGLYTAALGASESKGIVSLLRGLGYEMKPVWATDAKKPLNTSSTGKELGS